MSHFRGVNVRSKFSRSIFFFFFPRANAKGSRCLGLPPGRSCRTRRWTRVPAFLSFATIPKSRFLFSMGIRHKGPSGQLRSGCGPIAFLSFLTIPKSFLLFVNFWRVRKTRGCQDLYSSLASGRLLGASWAGLIVAAVLRIRRFARNRKKLQKRRSPRIVL